MIFESLSKEAPFVPEAEKFDLNIPESFHTQWKATWSPSFQIRNFFEEDEIQWLTDLMFKEHLSRRVKECGTLHFFCNNNTIKEKFYEKFKKVVPQLNEDDIWGGNFLVTSSPYNLHTDSGRPSMLKDGIVPSKQIIIPLFVCHTNKHYRGSPEVPEAGTGIFKNRFIKYGVNFAKGDQNYTTDVYYTVRDYSDLRCFNVDGSEMPVDWNKGFDEVLYQRYFSHFPKRWLDGFALDQVYNWHPRSIIVFDCSQAHSGINFPANQVTMKAGFSLMINRRIKW